MPPRASACLHVLTLPRLVPLLRALPLDLCGDARGVMVLSSDVLPGLDGRDGRAALRADTPTNLTLVPHGWESLNTEQA